MRKYRKAMDTLQVTPEMETRILQGLTRKKQRSFRRIPAMVGGVAAACLLLAALTGLPQRMLKTSDSRPPETHFGTPNHFVGMDNRDDEIDSSLATTKPGDREWQDDGLDWAPPEPDHAEEPATYTLLADGVVLLRYRAEGVAVSCYVTRDGSLPLPAADFSRSEIREGITLSTRDEDKADCFSCAAWQEDGLSFRLETDDPVPAETLLRLVGSLT